jgi:hypothetical protein
LQGNRRTHTLRDIVHVLQGVSGALERGKGLELDHLAELCEISGGLADISELGANLLRLQTLKESITRGALVQEVVDLRGTKVCVECECV